MGFLLYIPDLIGMIRPSILIFGVSMLTSGFRMIAAAICPMCKHEFWLMDEPMFDPGAQPPKYLGESPITFLFCGQEHTVPPSSVVYRPQRVIKSKAAEAS